jgi:hypothetical protein
MLESAFDNDPRFAEAESKRKGQIDAGFEDDEEESMRRRRRAATTLVQEQWRNTQLRVTPELVANTKWTLDLYLAGVPSRDPSNDLFASRENISNRDRALGIQIPDTPTLRVELTMNANQECHVSSSEFTTDAVPGQWKLSDDGKQLRFSIQTLGYSRTVETKGSIQNIYGIAWKRDRSYETTATYGGGDGSSTTTSRQQTEASQPPVSPNPTSFVYSIPPGWIYADVQVVRVTNKNTLQMVTDTGVLRVEQPRGWIGSAMVPCGKFTATLVQ